ncbi:unnamed protein product [Brassica oleracea var. botrytis]
MIMIADSDCIVLVEAEAEAEAEKYPDRRLRKEDTEAFEVEVRMDILEKDTEIGKRQDGVPMKETINASFERWA